MTQQSSEQLEHQSYGPEIVAGLGAYAAIWALTFVAGYSSAEGIATYDAMQANRSQVVSYESRLSGLPASNPEHQAIQDAIDALETGAENDKNTLQADAAIAIGFLMGAGGAALSRVPINRSINRKKAINRALQDKQQNAAPKV